MNFFQKLWKLFLSYWTTKPDDDGGFEQITDEISNTKTKLAALTLIAFKNGGVLNFSKKDIESMPENIGLDIFADIKNKRLRIKVAQCVCDLHKTKH